MKISFIKNIADFKAIENDWNKLYLNLNLSVFQSFDFNYFSWINELDFNNLNRLCIILLKEENLISTIFPLYIDNKNRLRFINDKHIDSCDILSNCDFNLEFVLENLNENFNINYIYFENIKDSAHLFKIFNHQKIKYSFIRSSNKYSDLSFFAGEFPDNDIRYKSKHKTEFRRIKKINSNYHYEILETKNHEFPKHEILKLRQAMTNDNIRDSKFLSKKMLSLLEALFLKNKLILSVVKIDNTYHSCSFILKVKNNYLFWIDLYDDSKLINIFNYICFIEKISSKIDVNISFGRGIYNYKISNFSPKVKELFSLYIFNNEFKLFFYSQFFKLNLLAKSIFKKNLK